MRKCNNLNNSNRSLVYCQLYEQFLMADLSYYSSVYKIALNPVHPIFLQDTHKTQKYLVFILCRQLIVHIN